MSFSGHETEPPAHMTDEERLHASPSDAKPRTVDQDIVAAFEAGRRERAVTLLAQHHALPIGRACMALLGNQGEAEDALQETLLAALDGIERFRGEGTLRAWLLGIARRRCARRLESRAKDQKLRQALATSEVAPSAERETLAGQARRLLSEIKPTEREALVLRFAGDLSFREVGISCGIDEAAARKRVSRGLSRLRALLGEDES